jgi:hypothetical protein
MATGIPMRHSPNLDPVLVLPNIIRKSSLNRVSMSDWDRQIQVVNQNLIVVKSANMSKKTRTRDRVL